MSDQVQRLLDRLEAAWTALRDSYAGVPDGRLVEIPGAAHTVPADRPDDFVRHVRAFLEG